MIAASVAYDLTFLVHIVVAVAAFTVLTAMRSSAHQVAHGAPSATQSARFPPRRNWAARLVHLLPLTGLVLSLSGDRSLSLARAWIGVGIICYLAAAGYLEARTLPLERAVADDIRSNGVATVERGRLLVRSVDTVLAILGVALVAMVLQF